MKKTILLTLMAFCFSLIQSQDESSYMMIMVKHKKSFKMAQSEQDFVNLANSFERIADAESDQWHPLYYAALCYVNMSFVNKDNTQSDEFLDKAQTYLDKAFEIFPDESELFSLQALVHQGRIQIDPVGRGMTYSMKAGEAINRAKEYNADNPRSYYLEGMNVLHTPEAFGGGAEPACKLFKTAIQKYNSFKPDHVLSPTWGAERNEQLYNQNCGDKE